MTRKNIILSIQTAVFFALMLAGTLFGQRIGDCFRPSVAVRQPEYRKISYKTTATIESEERYVVTERLSLLLPSKALRQEEEGFYVYLLQTRTEAFGTYYTLEKRLVNIEMQDEFIIVLSGLSPNDYIVPDVQELLESGENLEAGQRVVPMYLSSIPGFSALPYLLFLFCYPTAVLQYFPFFHPIYNTLQLYIQRFDTL